MMFPIKVKAMKFGLRQQQGFSLLEALLSIVIILAAGLGVVELFISADKKNKVNTTQQIVQQAASAASQLVSASYGDSTAASTQTVINSGLMSSSYVSKDGKSIIGPYGTLTVGQDTGTYSEYHVIASGIPGDQAVILCQNMFASAAVSLSSGGTPGTTFATSIGDCSKKSFFGGQSSTKLAVAFSFPREDFVTNSSSAS